MYFGNLDLPDTKKKEELIQSVMEQLKTRYEQIEKSFPIPGLMGSIIRSLFLKTLDKYWIRHIDALEHLREGINLQSYGQRDPKVEYKLEAYELFEEMIKNVRETVVRASFNMSVIPMKSPDKAKAESPQNVKKNPVIIRKATSVISE